MEHKKHEALAMAPALGRNPLTEDVMERTFYRPARDDGEDKPTHYKIVSISLYLEDIDLLNRMVADLKAKGHTKANKSALIRAALRQCDLDKVPKNI
ncbi:MAG: hypothetical protein KIT79_10750 [Deltaproteobacteria bacterium]|nr:hypothetical protein [Deltaproteobacteria bacterium]